MSPSRTPNRFIFTGYILLAWLWIFVSATAAIAQSPQDGIENHGAVRTQESGKHNSPEPKSGHAGEDLGARLPLWSCLPFAGMLLSIALWPLAAPEFWHHHFGKISAFWALCLAAPFVYGYRATAVYEILHILLADYVPFIILLWSLYTVSGGILLRGSLRGTPAVNLILLAIGTALASWMGTTGAAMLMIRPFLRANKHRQNRTFMVVFFIFLVANIGGALTPLGDPPLFLGFLHGVTFFWTLKLTPHLLCMAIFLMGAYFIIDAWFYHKEKPRLQAIMDENPGDKDDQKVPLRLVGSHNFIFLAGIVGAVLFSGTVDWGEINTLGIHRGIQDWIRDGMLILMGVLSLLTTSARVRQENEFSWFPIQEVAYLFIGIFITMLPCLLILKAGENGALAFLIFKVKQPIHYFWVTGALSSFLDNAPTYLTFFNSALGAFYAGIPESQSVALLMTEHDVYLEAISAGAVFFGACSYIGNAPNFMVRSIAEESGTPMPSFFGYMLKYSLVFLVPGFIMTTLLFFT
ncbi:MAG: sodium:proton antiporter [Desulfobacteraceae bacterium]